MDNTTFGGDVPTVPRWSGPPHTIIQVQAILYASLAASLLSALLAMLGKQWLNRYASTEMRGTTVERGRDRQRKLNGIDNWYFEHVMESLPLMLQAALVLLGCALSRYLWEINTTIALVVLGVTAFGILFYIFIVVAGATSESCPFQTPGSRILRSTPSAVVSATSTIMSATSAFGRIIGNSATAYLFRGHVTGRDPSPDGQMVASLGQILQNLPFMLALDASCLGRAMVHSLVAFLRRVYAWLRNAPSTPTHGSDQQTTSLDIQCASWILQTSLDKAVHPSTLESFATTVPLDDIDPTFLANCFDVFIGCVKVANETVVVTQGSERLAIASAISLLHAFSYLLITDPMLAILENICQRYRRIFPLGTNFSGLPFSDTLGTIGKLFHDPNVLYLWQRGFWPSIEWWDHKPSNHEHVVIVHALAKLSRSEYQRTGRVPAHFFCLVAQFLFWDPLLSGSVVLDCLSIIAIDLGCDISSTRTTISDERYVHT